MVSLGNIDAERRKSSASPSLFGEQPDTRAPAISNSVGIYYTKFVFDPAEFSWTPQDLEKS